MKIICIEGNYSSSESALGLITEPVFFLKPESSVLRNSLPFFIPDHTQQIIPRCNIVLKICRLGKNIRKKFSNIYYDEIGIGIDMEAADLLEKCKAASLPWESAKAYDNSSPIGNFIPVKEIKDIGNIPFSIFKNNLCIASENTSKLIHDFGDIIEHVTKFMTIKTGDLIFTGSPPLKETVRINDHIDCFIGDKKMLSFNVK